LRDCRLRTEPSEYAANAAPSATLVLSPEFFFGNLRGTEHARTECGMSLTREDLYAGLHRFATKHDLERLGTKQDLGDLREETAQGFVEMRRHVETVADDLAATIRVMLEALAARIESIERHRAQD